MLKLLAFVSVNDALGLGWRSNRALPLCLAPWFMHVWKMLSAFIQVPYPDDDELRCQCQAQSSQCKFIHINQYMVMLMGNQEGNILAVLYILFVWFSDNLIGACDVWEVQYFLLRFDIDLTYLPNDISCKWHTPRSLLLPKIHKVHIARHHRSIFALLYVKCL